MTTAQPNILIVTTDQQRADSIGCYGSDFMATPHLDLMAADGVRLNRAYCTNPVCTPSRVSIFTGKQVSRHGAWNVGVNCAPDEIMISHMLGKAGYRTHYVGKAHFQAFGAAPELSRESTQGWKSGYGEWRGPYFGFDSVELALGHTSYGISGHYGEWVRQQVDPEIVESWTNLRDLASTAFGANAYDWSIPLRYHNSVWTADRTIEFLQAHDRRQPFLLAVGFQDPHHPHAVPTEFQERVDPSDVPEPDFMLDELADKPPHFLEAHEGRLEKSAMRGDFPFAGQGSGFDYRQVTENDARLGRAYYYTMVQLIDQQMGRILATLESLGLAENTLVIFTSDHGELLGDHGIWMKGPFHYEPLVRVPALMRWPRGLSGGQVVDGLFSLADIVPTCLAAAGVDTSSVLDGHDALPLLRGEVDGVREDVLIEVMDDLHKLRAKTIVSVSHKLTWYAGKTCGELYDLSRDPREKHNLWLDPEHTAVKAYMLDRLLDYGERIEPRQPRLVYA